MISSLQHSEVHEAFIKYKRNMFDHEFKEFQSQFLKEADMETKYLLNVECTQFPLGKTGKTLNRIALLNSAKIHSLHTTDNNSHTISIIISSCNLAETAQWKVRAKNEFGKKLNITTISSKTQTTRGGSGKNIGNFIQALATLPYYELPNILLMCCHSKRVNDDAIALLEAQRRLVLGFGKKYKYNIFIDEADKNIKLVTRALKTIKRLKLEKYITEIHFITATPSASFWNALKKINIKKLDNFDIEFGKNITDKDRQEASLNYQSILTQDFIGYDCYSNDPIDYINKVLSIDAKLVNPKQRQILFVPGARKLTTHHSIKDYFLERGYWVFMHNGKFKGFIDPIGKREITVEEFKIKNKMKNKELRDVFVLWNKQNLNKNLAITGLTTILRGITFCTTGFNFTHMIFCACHVKNLADFVQLLGRVCGNKLYCDKTQIIGLSHPFEEAKKFVKNILELKIDSVEKYTKEDFKINKKNKNIHMEIRDTMEDIKTHIKKIWPRSKPLNKSKDIPDMNSNGFYENVLRSERKVYHFDDIKKERYWGVGNKYRIHVCYENITDKNTMKWVACYNKDWVKK